MFSLMEEWKNSLGKKDSNSKTTLKAEDGTPIYLSRGNTIWNIVDKNSSLSFN